MTMTLVMTEESIHDAVNLNSLVRKLKASVHNKDWEHERVQNKKWLKSKSMLQSVNYAQKLLNVVEMRDADPAPSSQERFDGIREDLHHIRELLNDVEKQLAPKPRRLPPMLPTIPIPASSQEKGSDHAPPDPLVSPENVLISAKTDDQPEQLLSSPQGVSLATNDLLLSPSDSLQSSIQPILPPAASLSPPTLSTLPTKSTSTSTTTTSHAFQTSQALQEELSAQLAQMATQLKRNAVHFADLLEKDKAVTEGLQEKMEGNFDVMQAVRVRVRDARGKTWNTTWITVAGLVGVLIAFVLTAMLIRLT